MELLCEGTRLSKKLKQSLSLVVDDPFIVRADGVVEVGEAGLHAMYDCLLVILQLLQRAMMVSMNSVFSSGLVAHIEMSDYTPVNVSVAEFLQLLSRPLKAECSLEADETSNHVMGFNTCKRRKRRIIDHTMKGFIS